MWLLDVAKTAKKTVQEKAVSIVNSVQDEANAVLQSVQYFGNTEAQMFVEPNEDEIDEYEEYLKIFNLGEKTDEIAHILGNNSDIATLHADLVPVTLSYEEFWTRYYFRLNQYSMMEDDDENPTTAMKTKMNPSLSLKEKEEEKEEDEIDTPMDIESQLERWKARAIQLAHQMELNENYQSEQIQIRVERELQEAKEKAYNEGYSVGKGASDDDTNLAYQKGLEDGHLSVQQMLQAAKEEGKNDALQQIALDKKKNTSEELEELEELEEDNSASTTTAATTTTTSMKMMKMMTMKNISDILLKIQDTLESSNVIEISENDSFLEKEILSMFSKYQMKHQERMEHEERMQFENNLTEVEGKWVAEQNKRTLLEQEVSDLKKKLQEIHEQQKEMISREELLEKSKRKVETQNHTLEVQMKQLEQNAVEDQERLVSQQNVIYQLEKDSEEDHIQLESMKQKIQKMQQEMELETKTSNYLEDSNSSSELETAKALISVLEKERDSLLNEKVDLEEKHLHFSKVEEQYLREVNDLKEKHLHFSRVEEQYQSNLNELNDLKEKHSRQVIELNNLKEKYSRQVNELKTQQEHDEARFMESHLLSKNLHEEEMKNLKEKIHELEIVCEDKSKQIQSLLVQNDDVQNTSTETMDDPENHLSLKCAQLDLLEKSIESNEIQSNEMHVKLDELMHQVDVLESDRTALNLQMSQLNGLHQEKEKIWKEEKQKWIASLEEIQNLKDENQKNHLEIEKLKKQIVDKQNANNTTTSSLPDGETKNTETTNLTEDCNLKKSEEEIKLWKSRAMKMKMLKEDVEKQMDSKLEQAELKWKTQFQEQEQQFLEQQQTWKEQTLIQVEQALKEGILKGKAEQSQLFMSSTTNDTLQDTTTTTTDTTDTTTTSPVSPRRQRKASNGQDDWGEWE